MRKITVLMLLFLCTNTFSQDSDNSICDCCTYEILQWKNEFDEIFNPLIIKTNNIKELTIYTTSKQNNLPKVKDFKIIDKEYKEMIFNFNENGFVESQIVFNRRGKYHSIYEFKRNSNNKVISKTFYYLDSIGGKGKFPEKTIYVYSGDKLIKIKELDFNGIEQPDNKSKYESYNYDVKGRVIFEKQYTYYDDMTEATIYDITTKYDDKTNTSVSIQKEKKKVFITTNLISNSKQKPLNEKVFDGKGKILIETMFTYNNDNEIVKFISKNTGMGDECPEYGNFENIYTYSPIKLIDNIKHQYKNTVCEMRFSYKFL